MQGAARVMGLPTRQIEIGGKAYLLGTRVLRYWGEIEAHILRKRPHPLDALKGRLEQFSPEVQERLIAAAMRELSQAQSATAKEFQQFAQSPEGVAMNFWLAVRANHPEVDSLEKAFDLIEQCSQEKMAELQRKLDDAAGGADLKNSGGPAVDLGAAKAVTETEPHESRGHTSIAS